MAEDLGKIYYRVEADTTQLIKAEADMGRFGSGAQKAEKDVSGLEQGNKKLGASTDGMTKAVKAATTALVAMGAAIGIREVIAYADAWTGASNQLRQVTKTAAELTTVQSKLMGVANDTRSSFESTANLYARLARATTEMGLSQQDLIGLTTTINKSFAASGATASEAAAAITQLSQGLASGALRGDEFNSVAEQAPGIMRAIASSLKMTVGDLREFAAEGGITAEIVVNALQEASGQIEKDFSVSVMTFGQAVQVAKNNMMEAAGTSKEVESAVASLSAGIITLSEVAVSATQKVSAFFNSIKFLAEEAAAAINGPALGDLPRLYDALEAAEKKLEAAQKSRSSAGRIELEVEVARLKEMIRVSEEMKRNEIAARNNAAATEDLVGSAQQMTHSYEGFVGPLREVEKGTKKYTDTLDEHVKARQKFLEKQADQRQSIIDTIRKLEQEQEALGMTARAQAVFNAVTEAYNKGAAPEQIAKIAELTAKNYDLAESSKKTGDEAESAAKLAQENWQRTHEYMTGAFIDLMNNGGNAFDNIAKSFSSMVQRMVAEWAASGLMNMLGIGGGSVGGTASGVVGSLLSGGAGAGAGGIGASIAGAAGSAWGAITGAASTAGSAAMSALGAIPGWGWALAAGGLAAAALGNKSTPSSNAGMLIRQVGNGERQFDVPAFASGFDPVGFARREDQAAATQVIDVFRADDAALTALASASGLSVNYNANNFGGYDEKGQGSGLFFGSAGEDGRNTAVPIDQQRTQFISQWIKGLSGQVDQSLINDVLSQGSADAMLLKAAQLAGVDGSHAMGLNRVPFDGYIAELHKDERVLTKSEADAQDGMAGLSGTIGLELLKKIARLVSINERWDYDGLPPTRA